MASVSLEELDQHNHDQVRALILDGLRDHWGSVDEHLNADLDDMLASYSSGRTLVARDGRGRVVGTGTVVAAGPTTAQIVRMSVGRDLRGRGIGRQILRELVDTAAGWGCTRVVLETTSAWTGAVDFYLRCGFAITHLVDGESGTDTWFELHLTPRSTTT